jgi:hypothetical protein
LRCGGKEEEEEKMEMNRAEQGLPIYTFQLGMAIFGIMAESRLLSKERSRTEQTWDEATGANLNPSLV